MTSERRFYKTVIQVVVLTEGFYEVDSLAQVDTDTMTGDASGEWTVTESTCVDGQTMARLLQEQGSDPSFFQLDEEGNDLEDDSEEE